MTLKEWRAANRYSQPAFARLLEEKAGLKVDRSTVWYWENGVTPRKPFLVAIRKLTGGKVTLKSFLS